MPEKFQNKYRIDSNRWQYWDYSAPGSYFITICIQDRDEILGKIIDGKMQLSEYGEIVKNEFINMASYNQRAAVDEWIIMPNHVHCIITLRAMAVNPIDNVGFVVSDKSMKPVISLAPVEFGFVAPDGFMAPVEKIHEFSLQSPARPLSATSPPSLPTEIDIKQYRRLRRKMLIPLLTGKFQMLTSKQINILRNTSGRKTWQPNYHDHVIRDEQEYYRIQQYIINNPAKWDDDTFNDNNNNEKS
jgi:putative transposase